MKKILKDTCFLASLMIIVVFGVSVIWSGFTAEIVLVFELFALALVISAANCLFDEFSSLPLMFSYVIKYFMITAIVMLFGFIVGWFYPGNFWMAFIYVGIVLILAYFLDSFLVRRDIDFINQKLNNRK